MRFDKAQIEAIAALPDEELWSTVVNLAKGYGFNLPHEELEKLRGAVNSPKINVSDAMRLLNQYKKGSRDNE